MHFPAGALVVGAAAGAACLFSWLTYEQRAKRERAVLLGCSLGAATPLAGYPLVEALWGVPGLQALVAADVVNSTVTTAGCQLAFATAGAAFPENYEHEDGGTYRWGIPMANPGLLHV